MQRTANSLAARQEIEISQNMEMIACLLAIVTTAQKSSPKEPDLVFKKAVAVAKHSKKIMFMHVQTASKDKWVKMRSDSDHLDKQDMWRDDVSEVAYAYENKGHVVLVALTRGDESGDWFDNATCAYRPNGSLAKSSETYSAFSPEEGSVQFDSAYSSTGALIAQKTTVTTLKGKKITDKTKEKGLIFNAERMVKDTHIQKKVSAYGFASMIQNKPSISIHKHREKA